jgi:hypothetical protein
MKTKPHQLNITIAAAGVALFLSGCSMNAMNLALHVADSYQYATGEPAVLASSEDDVALKKFIPKTEMAGIYVYRNEAPGNAIPLLIDGKAIGTIYPKSFVYYEVVPGKHVVAINSPGAHDKIEMETEPSKNYFVWQQAEWITPILIVKCSLHRVTEEDGRKGVLETHLAKKSGNQDVD